jgi:hypothetical protein
VDEVVEYLGLPDTDVNMRSEARARALRGATARRERRAALTECLRCCPSALRRAAHAARQDLSTALHYACTFGGHDHPAIAKARQPCCALLAAPRARMGASSRAPWRHSCSSSTVRT